MYIDPKIMMYLQGLQITHPLPRDPNGPTAFVQRHDACVDAVLAEFKAPENALAMA